MTVPKKLANYEFYQNQKRWAFLVGGNRYDDSNFNPLKFCVNDVRALEQLLTQLGYTVTSFYDDHPDRRLPTIEAVEDALEVFTQTVGENDLAFVHFACHGDVYEKKEKDGTRTKHPVLILQNTYRNSYARRSLHVEELEERLCGMGAKNVFLSLDACHVGVEIGRNASDPEFIDYICKDSKGFTLLAGSTAQQKAQEWDAVEHGVYTYYLLKGLAGDAGHGKDASVVTANSLQDYVLASLKKWRLANGFLPQEPTRKVEGTGDMMLACWEGIDRPASLILTPNVSTSSRVETRSQPTASLSPTRRQFYERQLAEMQRDLACVESDLAVAKTREEMRRLNIRAEQLLEEIEKLDKKLH